MKTTCSHCQVNPRSTGHAYCPDCRRAYARDYERNVRRAHRKADPIFRFKERARKATRKAVARGTIAKLPCRVCGDPKVEAHHPDYTKRFNVVWLCSLHHHELHDAVRKKREMRCTRIRAKFAPKMVELPLT